MTEAREHRICSRCVCDSSFPGITFDAEEVCSYCALHAAFERQYPRGPEGRRIVERHVEAVKRRGRGREFDCVVGVSGGRDSTYLLWLTQEFGLRPLAVHFNDGFGNPVAGENMTRATEKLGVPLRIVTSDWRESKDLKLAFLRSSTPDIEEATDLGLAAALYGQATREGLRDILIGMSFRTEGISPLEWNYLDGTYLKAVHKRFGSHPLRPWKPDDPGFNLGVHHIAYYAFVRRIRVFLPLYYWDYERSEVDAIITKELGWIYPGAHYFDDLYQALMTYVFRTKFGIDRRKFNYSALIRSGQMEREHALKAIAEVYRIEDPKVIDLCIKRLGLTRDEFQALVDQPPKTFRDYPSTYPLMRALRWPILLASRIGIVPGPTAAKYFMT